MLVRRQTTDRQCARSRGSPRERPRGRPLPGHDADAAVRCRSDAPSHCLDRSRPRRRPLRLRLFDGRVRATVAEHKRRAGLENFRLTVTDPTFQAALEHNGRLLAGSPHPRPDRLLLSVLLSRGASRLALSPGNGLSALYIPDPSRRHLRPDPAAERLEPGLRGVGVDARLDWPGDPVASDDDRVIAGRSSASA